MLDRTGRGSRWCAEAALLFNYYAPIPAPDVYQENVDRAIRRLKDNGVWNYLDALYVHAAYTQQHGLINWVNPSQSPLVEYNSPTWSARYGYTGNASNMYVEGPVNYSSLTKFLQNDCHMAVWGLANTGGDGNQTLGAVGNANIQMYPKATYTDTDEVMAWLNSGDGDRLTTGALIGRAAGLTIVQRNGSTTVDAYKNGKSLGALGASTSTSRPAAKPCLFRSNATYSSGTCAMFSLGGYIPASLQPAYYMTMLEFFRRLGVTATYIPEVPAL